MLIALHRGKGFIARAIRWQTRSVYSHASIVLEESECVVEAREFEGVRMVLWRDVVASGEVVDLFRVKGLTEEAEECVREFLWEQMGKAYDYTMVARFISRRQEERASSGKWFCSELVFAALAKAGVRLLERVEAWEVSPGMLRLSTRLEQMKNEEGRMKKAGRTGGPLGNVQRPTFNVQRSEGEGLATDGTRITRIGGISDLRFEISKGREMGCVRRYQGLFGNWIRSGFGGGVVRTPRPTGMGKEAVCDC
ncbi:MAG TPA: YiiX/YebB-like N1pC/P60 family cysteine hydrolase [Verrucomicrobiae bacterium]